MTDRISIAEYHDRIAALAPAHRERAGEAEQTRRLSQQRDEYDIVDDWQVTGLRGTGSKSLASGGMAIQETHPLQQLNRDAKAMALHAALAHENNLELWGASRLGKPLNSEFV